MSMEPAGLCINISLTSCLTEFPILIICYHWQTITDIYRNNQMNMKFNIQAHPTPRMKFGTREVICYITCIMGF